MPLSHTDELELREEVVSALASYAKGPGFDSPPAARKVCWVAHASIAPFFGSER